MPPESARDFSSKSLNRKPGRRGRRWVACPKMRPEFGNACCRDFRAGLSARCKSSRLQIRISLSPTIVRGDFRKTPTDKIRLMSCDAPIFPVPHEGENEPVKY